ncbi:hypothetical protein KVV02_006629 [Mortierella alpina]|uniref:Probable lysosomal cobalamin transporter n=1 Tax=Mortierella alpina TaxID=64518 RepID=A0A9P8D0P7_MORAP|nr:hypothetical protein KVV02_006629 [Mortierella alpina]
MLDGILHQLGAWGAFGLMGSILLGFSIFFTLYYSDRQDREPFAMLVTVLALTLCLTTVALFPVDIFLVSRIMDPTTGLRYEWATDEAIAQMQLSVKVIYTGAYSLIASFIFFWIPLSYFYFEELADEEQTLLQRLWASLRYTVFFMLVAAILLLTGLFMKPDRHEDIDLDWLRKILADPDGSGALSFVAGVMALAGMGVLVFYAAPGLSLLPLHMLAGSSSIPARVSETHAQLAANRERQNSILNRYRHRGDHSGSRNVSRLSDRDRQAISELAQEEIILENRSINVQRVRDSCFHRYQCIIRPFQIILGLAGTILTALLVAAIIVTSIDQMDNDFCGGPCGYIFSGKNLPNPLNILFLKLSPYFPIDYILIVMIILYMFWATTKGIISIGIRILWVNLYSFRRATTQPQGLLAATMLLMLSLAGLSYSLTMSVAPEYSMFGSQKYCNHTIPVVGRDCSDYPSLIIPCHIDAPAELCVLTVTSSNILKIILATPVLGRAFYSMQWIFVGTFLLALVINLILGCRRGFEIDPLDEGEEDLEELETRGLLSGSYDSEDARRRARRRGLITAAAAASGDAHSPIQGQRQGRGPAYGAVRQG